MTSPGARLGTVLGMSRPPAPTARRAPALLARIAALPRPGGFDLLAAVLLAYVSSVIPPEQLARGASVLSRSDPRAVSAVYIALVAVCVLAVLVRRLHPTASVMAIGAALVVHLVCFDTLSLLVIGAGLLAAETTASRVSRPVAWVLLGTEFLGAVACVGRAWFTGGGPLWSDPGRLAVVATITLVFVAAGVLTGLLRRRVRERREERVERLGLIAVQQDTERQLAVVQERTRIAREVHDLLGHSLAVIGMQAEGARAVLATDPDAADAALAVIGGTSRQAVDDVRALVDVLRSDQEEARADGAAGPPLRTAGSVVESPAAESPGVEDLPALVAGVRTAGNSVLLRLTLEVQLPQEVSACLYRVAQEALTNAVRHAPGAPISLALAVDEHRAELSVRNGPGAGRTAAAEPRAGLGLASMRERLHAVGGILAGGSEPDGGWRVRAIVPLTGAGAGAR